MAGTPGTSGIYRYLLPTSQRRKMTGQKSYRFLEGFSDFSTVLFEVATTPRSR